MHKADLSTLHPELMAVWQRAAILPTAKGQEHVRRSGLLVYNITTVHQIHPAWNAVVACVSLGCVESALEPFAVRRPRHRHATIALAEEIQIRICRRLDCRPVVTLSERDGLPTLRQSVVERVLRVEEPVIRSGDDGFDSVNGDTAQAQKYLRADDVRVRRIGDDQLCVGGALGRVVDASAVVNLEGLREDAGQDINRLVVFDILRGRYKVVDVKWLADALGGDVAGRKL